MFVVEMAGITHGLGWIWDKSGTLVGRIGIKGRWSVIGAGTGAGAGAGAEVRV